MEMTLGVTARDIMTSQVQAARADWTIDRLADFLIQHAITGAPVLSDSGFLLVGAVSMTDIVRYRAMPQRATERAERPTYYMESHDVPPYTEDELEAFRLGEAPTALVRDIMTPAIYGVPEEASLSHVADTMVRNRIHRLFVTRDGRLVGIISALDVLRAISKSD